MRRRKEKTPEPMPVKSDMERLVLAIARLAVTRGHLFAVATLRTYADLLADPDSTFSKQMKELQEEYDSLHSS